jgi:hypothetical protein
LSGTRCCSTFGGACTEAADCCLGFFCNGATCQ